MSPDKLVEAMHSNRWSLAQPIDSILKKREKQKSRLAGKGKKKEEKGEEVQRRLDRTHREVLEGEDDGDAEESEPSEGG